MNEFDPSSISLDEWRGVAEASIKGRGIDSLDRRTEDGLTVKALYSAADLPDALPLLGRPGWTVAQEVEPARDADALNRMLLDEAAGGAERVDLAAGTDPALLAGALDGVETGAVGFGFAPGCDWPEAAEALSGLGRPAKRGPRAGDSLGFDPVLGLLNGKGDGIDALVEWAGGADGGLAGASIVAVAGDEYHLMGLAPAQELAVVLAATAHTLRCFEAGGIGPAATLEAMEWRFAGEGDLYGTIAKTRALAVLLRRVAEAAGGDAAGTGARIHGVTSARHLSRLDPETNILRNGTALLGMALGGAGIITVRPHDWLTGASPEAMRLARNAHHLVAREARLASTADPASGSYFMESLTRDIARQAWGLFQEIEAGGGVAESVGRIREWGGAAAAARQAAVDEGRENLLGVTVHPARRDGPRPAPVVEGVFGPRGGAARPAAPWEELRARAAGGSLRCLLVDGGDGGDAEACQRWFHVVGLEPVAIRCPTADEARAAIASARPDVLVLGGVDDPDSCIDAAGGDCRVVPADRFKGNCFELMGDIVGFSESNGPGGSGGSGGRS